LKPVIQLDSTGCGIASVEAIAGVSYSEAKSVAESLGISVSDPTVWSETHHVRNLVRHLALKAESPETPFQSREGLPELALLSIKWRREKGRPFWHWAVFVRENGHSCVLDSNKSLRHHARTDFGRMRPKWYIGVSAHPSRAAAEPQATRC